jgi:AraC-like DNA-binding protein
MYNVLWAAKYDYPAGWGIKRHSHPYFQIFYALSGTGRFVVQESPHVLEKDKYLIVAPDQPHEMLKVEQGEFIMSEIKFSADGADAERVVALSGAYTAEDATVRGLLDGIRREGRSAKPYYKQIIAAYLDLLVNISARSRLLSGGAGRTQAREGTVLGLTGIPGRVATYLREHLRGEVTLDALASELGYNKNYLCGLFRQAAGCTIREYLNRLKVEKAKEMIINSDYSIMQVGAWLGFEYPHHFDRVFRQVTGMTPGQFKRQEVDELNRDILIEEGFENPMQIDKA